ncbi:MAG: sugar phosphate isomerase/epimerase family protein [Armatimonadota bacterium]
MGEDESMLDNTQIAAQLYTVREFCKTARDMEQTLHKLRNIGYSVVQISGIGPISYPEIKKLLDETGMTCCATHIPFERMVNETEQVIEEHYLIQCKYPAIGSLPSYYRTAEGYVQFAKDATNIGKKLANGGLHFAYHNHSFELEKYGKRTGLQILYEESDPRYFKAEIDTYWIQHGGGDPAAWIEKLAGRIPLVHLKDMAIRNGQQIMAEVGEGNLNWPRIIEACKKAGVEWYIVEQDTCERDPFESLAISLNNLKAMGIK